MVTNLIIITIIASSVIDCLFRSGYLATLPQSGFEWNINDTVLNMTPFSSILGILELLTTCSVGAQLVLNGQISPMDCGQLATLVKEHQITACIMHSFYIIDLIKSQVSLDSLGKVIFTQQPIHRNIVSIFRKKFNIYNCRYGYCMYMSCMYTLS